MELERIIRKSLQKDVCCRMNQNIINLFPTALGVYDTNYHLTEQEYNFVVNIPKTKNIGNLMSVNSFVLENKIITNLKEIIKKYLKIYFEEVYQPKYPVNLNITQSWLNFSQKGQHHHSHTHPNSLVSGVFYIETYENDKIIYEKNDSPQIMLFSQKANKWNNGIYVFSVKKSHLYLFPSTLRHFVPVVETNTKRISLSFNTFPTGDLGKSEDGLASLTINDIMIK